MSLEQWGLVGTYGTLAVIAATAAAAIVQLRHLRQSNQLNALLTVLRMPYDAVLHDAFEFVYHELAEKIDDPDFMALLDSSPVDRRAHKELWVCDYYERLGAYVKAKLIDAAVYLDSSSPEQYWKKLRPIVKRMRSKRGSSVYENFEYLAYLAQRWDDEHPDGTYPRGTPRLSLE